MAGRVTADRSIKWFEAMSGVVDRSIQSSYIHTKVSLLHSCFGMAIGNLVSRVGNFVSQILNSTMLVIPMTVVHCEISRSLCRFDHTNQS